MMARNNTSNAGFSLIEVVIALGIFSFCIVAIVGLLPVGMNSVRSVSNENNAIHIASSIEGIWQVVPTNTSITYSNFPITNLYIGITNNAPPFYFNEFGEQTDSAGSSVNMTYTANASTTTSSAYDVKMVFKWPPHATSANATIREFSYTISK
ncbi:Verru_Chthon cassette protein B [bacterium]|nr:Verru_Chthon cassette protein B [bacterium]